AGTPCFPGSIEQCDSRWQAAARSRRIAGLKIGPFGPKADQLRGAAVVAGLAAGFASVLLGTGLTGLPALAGFAVRATGLAAAAGLSAGFAAVASGLTWACRAAGLAAGTVSLPASDFASVVATGFLPAARVFLPRCTVCAAASAALAAISAS